MSEPLDPITKIVIRLIAPLCYLLLFLPRRKSRLIEADLDWHTVERGKDIMGRRVNGEWQYRAMTDAEYQRYIADRW
jgi:hypothetical protein